MSLLETSTRGNLDGRIVQVVMRYDSSDPYAIHLAYADRPGRLTPTSIERIISREALDRGAYERTNIVAPSDSGRIIHIFLDSSVLSLLPEVVNKFLADTYELVSPGQESVDVDALIESILSA